jgi:hypothetical protein
MRRLARIVPSVAALLLLTLLASSRVALAASERTCVNGGQQNPDIAAGKTVLQRSPTRLGKRMELANLLEKAGCYDEAVHLLEEGQKYTPFNPALLFSLRLARNLVREEHYREGMEQAEAGARLNRKLQALRSQRQSTQRQDAIARTESTVHKERPTQVAAISAEAEAMVEPQNFSNVAEATRSN